MNLPALRHVGSSRTRDSTQVPCISRQILNYCAAREPLLKKEKSTPLAALCLGRSMWDPSPQPGIGPGSPALGVQRLSHWPTRGVPGICCFLEGSGDPGSGRWRRREVEMLLSRPSLLAATPAVVLTGAGRDLGSSMVHKVLTMGGGKFGCSVRV